MTVSLMRVIFSFSTIILTFNSLVAESKIIIKDYGIRGHIFPIIEESMLEVIMVKLKAAQQNGLLEKLQQEFIKKVKKKIVRPVLVAGLYKAMKNRSWLYDPTFTQETAIKDQNGRTIVAAGTIVNPLDTLSWGEPLILIDGDDKKQVGWVKSQQGKLVLTNGSPIELSQILLREVYFDQGGILTQKFKIKAVPAIIEQEGKHLKVSEIAL